MRIDKGTRAVVTGGGSGLGRAFCHELFRRGARVLVSDLSLEAAQATAAGHEGAVALGCDVAKAEEVDALAAHADRLWGGADLVIANAGVAAAGRIGETPIADWRWLFDVNVFGVVNTLNAFVPRLRKQGRGHVLNVASAAGLTTVPFMGAYCASKHAVVAITETLHAELQGEGVGATVLCPTFFRTGIHTAARGPRWMEGLVEKLMARDKLGAEGVARFALDACERGELHALPHNEVLQFWRLRRLAPAWVAGKGKAAINAIAKRAGVKPEW